MTVLEILEGKPIGRRKFVGGLGALALYVMSGCINESQKQEEPYKWPSNCGLCHNSNRKKIPKIVETENAPEVTPTKTDKAPLYVSVSGENTRTIPYDARGEIEKIAKNLWELGKSDAFDAYRFLKGDIGVDVFLSSDESLLEEKSSAYSKLYKIVLKEGATGGKLQKPLKSGLKFSDMVEEMYSEVKRRAHILKKYDSTKSPITPKCAAVKNEGTKVAIKHAIIDGKNYLGIAWNTKGKNLHDDNSAENLESLFDGMYTSGGGTGTSFGGATGGGGEGGGGSGGG